jgi:hypothetical protein
MEHFGVSPPMIPHAVPYITPPKNKEVVNHVVLAAMGVHVQSILVVVYLHGMYMISFPAYAPSAFL